MNSADFMYKINMLIVHRALHTGEFVRIAKDAKEGVFAAHLLFSDIWDSFTALILLWEFYSFIYLFITWEVLNNCSFRTVIILAFGGKSRKKKKVENKIFHLSWSSNWFCQFTKMLKILPFYLKLLWEMVSVSKISLERESQVVCNLRHISCSPSLLLEGRSQSTLTVC